ncbi:MAG: SDR family NAD(P)-dependent oxidoreductase, partial [Nitrososphaera sp.]
MTYDFSGKVVLITGGTGALGRAVAQAFGTLNATTVVTYIIDEEREHVKAKIKTIAELAKADI